MKPVYRIQQRKSRPDETKYVLAIGDCHDSPRLPDKRFFAMGKYAKENKVDQVVQIGDFASVESLNRFDSNDTVKGREKPSFKDMRSFLAGHQFFHRGLGGYKVEKHVTLAITKTEYGLTPIKIQRLELLDQILFAH